MPHLHMIQWPDSGFSIRLPKEFLELLGVRENNEVEIFCQEDRAVIRRAFGQRRKAEVNQ